MRFNIITNKKRKSIIPPPPRGTSFPDYCSLIFIKEVDTLSRTLLPGGGVSYMTFEIWGRG